MADNNGLIQDVNSSGNDNRGTTISTILTYGYINECDKFTSPSTHM